MFWEGELVLLNEKYVTMVMCKDITASLFQHEGQRGVPQAVLPCSVADHHQGPGKDAENISYAVHAEHILQNLHYIYYYTHVKCCISSLQVLRVQMVVPYNLE